MHTTKDEFIEIVEIGEEIDVATSNYSIGPIKENNWHPRFKMHRSTLKSMEKKGLISADFFWRGARVTRLK